MEKLELQSLKNVEVIDDEKITIDFEKYTTVKSYAETQNITIGGVFHRIMRGKLNAICIKKLNSMYLVEK